MTSRPRSPRESEAQDAVAGILAAIILFAILFTTGAGYFLFISNSAQTTNQANATRQAALQQSSQEKLSLTVALSTVADPWGQVGDLWLRVNNTGGVSSTIVDVYVTSSATGVIASNSQVTAGSHYLRQKGTLAQKGDLNVTLPITLNVGATTRSLPGCGAAAGGCDIGVSKTSYLYVPGTVVVVSILTSGGNVFSAQYPPIPPTTTAIATLKQVTSNVAVVSNGGGGSALVVQMTASPPQVLSGATLTNTVTVYNYASSPVTGVTITMNSPSVTGTATVTALAACSPSPQSITGFGGIGNAPSVTFTCTYTASTGAVGGIASFSGYAQGTLAGVTISSAGAVSNTIQIGGTANVPTQGAFTVNFFFFKYSACDQEPNGSPGSFSYPSACTTTPATMPPASPSSLADGNYLSAGNNQYVAYYVEVTNNFNTTLPILEYSYLFLDPGISGEQYNFLAGTATNPQTTYYPNYCQAGGCGSNLLPTLTAYTGSTTTCAETGPSYAPPSPTTCIDIAPGQTVTLTFAACGYGSSNWAWAGAQDASNFDNSGGCTSSTPSLEVPEGLTLGVILSYLYKNSVYTQFMPFEGQIMLRSSSTLVSCSPSTFSAAGSTACTATVSDTDGTLGGTSTITPTGTVAFSANSSASGTFSNGGACTLSGGTGSSASCSVTFTPATGVDGYANATVAYPGDGSHGSSTNSTSLTITPIITSTLSASSIAVDSSVFGSSSLAAATATAGGTVTYEYFSGTSCGGTATTVSTVTVTNGVVPNSAAHTFSAAGAFSWNAIYSGDANNPGATSPCVGLTVNKLSPTIALSISATSIQAGGSASGSAILTGDTSTAGGTVNYEYFSGTSCGGTATTVSTVTVTNGVVPNSAAHTFTSVGSYSWLAIYNGDANNNVATSNCKSMAVTAATPTIATSLSVASIAAGSPVYDTATLSGATSTAGGTVAYYYYTNAACTTAQTQVGSSVTVASGIVPNSASQTFTSVGTYYWHAVYSGDTNNNGATSPCETLTVIKASPTLTTSLSPSSSVIEGTSVTDQATLSGITTTAGGTVTFHYYTGSTCTTGTTASGATTVTNGSPTAFTSTAHTFASVASYSWNAVYSGDVNNNAVTSACEQLAVTKASPAIGTTLSATTIAAGSSTFDTATLSGATANAAGTVKYEYFSGTSCGGTATTVSTVTVASGAVPNSAAHTFSSAGLFSWNAVYAGDGNNNGATSSCEPLTVTGTLTLNPTSLKHGATTTLTGSGYVASTVFSYCLSTSQSDVTQCDSGTIATFTSTSGGAVPTGTTLTVPNADKGSYFVIVYTGTTVFAFASLTST